MNKLHVYVTVKKEVSRLDMIQWVQAVIRRADPQRGEITDHQVDAELDRRGLKCFYEVET